MLRTLNFELCGCAPRYSNRSLVVIFTMEICPLRSNCCAFPRSLSTCEPVLRGHMMPEKQKDFWLPQPEHSPLRMKRSSYISCTTWLNWPFWKCRCYSIRAGLSKMQGMSSAVVPVLCVSILASGHHTLQQPRHYWVIPLEAFEWCWTKWATTENFKRKFSAISSFSRQQALEIAHVAAARFLDWERLSQQCWHASNMQCSEVHGAVQQTFRSWNQGHLPQNMTRLTTCVLFDISVASCDSVQQACARELCGILESIDRTRGGCDEGIDNCNGQYCQ